MVERCKIEIPIEVVYEMHTTKKENHIHKNIKILRIKLNKKPLSTETEKEILTIYQNIIKDICNDNFKNSFYINKED